MTPESIQEVNYNIYGDNILECEEALRIICDSYNSNFASIKSPLYSPKYEIYSNGKKMIFTLYPGYDRWDYDVKTQMQTLGAKLREATDAVITKVIIDSRGNLDERPVLAFEFCGALPAGNNAWQRSGRAISCAQSKIPYLYFAEIGGTELDGARKVKSARFPNPLIPFAYISLGRRYDSLTLPIYQPSPSISDNLYEIFKSTFADNDLLLLVRSILEKTIDLNLSKIFTQKAIQLTTLLSSLRKNKNNILQEKDWELLLNTEDSKTAEWFIQKGKIWSKRVTIPTTSTFKALLKFVTELQPYSVGSNEIPFCLLSREQLMKFKAFLNTNYASRLTPEFLSWLNKKNDSLYIVWVAGFKPRGDDSRPDRGLVPLLRMIIGEENDNVLTVIYGPCPRNMINKANSDVWQLAKENGLWQSILNYSNAFIIDSTTNSSQTAFQIPQRPQYQIETKTLPIDDIRIPKKFGEHDVDTVIHTIFTQDKDVDCYEGLCNPPGGNWSGISIYDYENKTHFRWTSLPRVSNNHAKRPDHLFQFKIEENPINSLVIESKDNPLSIEENIGDRLKEYINDLIKIQPNIYKTDEDMGKWRTYTSTGFLSKSHLYSAAAFKYSNEVELFSLQTKANVDCIMGIEFKNNGQTRLHLLCNNNARWLESILINKVQVFSNWLEVKVY